MPEKPILLPSPLVKMHNALARAAWPDGGQYDLDIIMHIASKIRMDDEDFKTYRFPVSELGYGKKLDGRTYRMIKDALERLSKSSVKVEEKHSKYFFYSLFSMAGYEDGAIVARFDPDLKPFFLQLTQHFTSFELMEMRMLPSGYSKRLFLLLKSFASLLETRILLTDLHDKLIAPGSFRADFRNFRLRVLEKAQKDLKDVLPFEWEPVKSGRAVVAINFIFSRGQKASLAALRADEKKKSAGIARRNKMFMAALRCAKSKNSLCRGNGGNADVCGLCLEFALQAQRPHSTTREASLADASSS